MTAKTCWECNSTFYSNYGAIYCNVCTQARKTREHNERQAREDRYRSEQIQRENARIAAQQTQALVNAENRKIAAINHQTRVISESIIKPADAYSKGYNYVDYEFAHGNSSDLEVEVGEYGGLTWKWNHPYVIDNLNEQFRKGLYDRLGNINVYPEVKSSAYQAGKQNANGTLQNRFFLRTGLSLGGVEIKTKVFNSNFTNTLDEITGEQVMRWDHPFKNEELNQAYLDGVNEVHWEVNTDEKKNYRLLVDVPELKAHRIMVKGTKRTDKMYRLLLGIFPILYLFIFWSITSGWGTFISFVALPFIWKFLEKQHTKWAENNSNYLKA